jgi:hypothetical protein
MSLIVDRPPPTPHDCVLEMHIHVSHPLPPPPSSPCVPSGAMSTAMTVYREREHRIIRAPLSICTVFITARAAQGLGKPCWGGGGGDT